MHGTLRFFLAILVALSHLGVSFNNFNQGVSAVVFFYILAGTVSYKLISNEFNYSTLAYYKNRINRIFPLYYFSLFIASLIYFIGVDSTFLSSEQNVINWISNIIVLPLSYYMYSGIDSFTLIPPAWSLAVELQFYILVPYIFKSKKLVIAIYIVSLIVFFLANINLLNTDYYGYRLLLGVIFIFILGSFIHNARQGKSVYKRILIVTFIILLVNLFIVYINDLKNNYNYETLFALLIAIPFLYYYQNTINLRIDRFLGSMSYGIFLLHFPALWINQSIFGLQNNYNILLITLILSYVGCNITKHFSLLK